MGVWAAGELLKLKGETYSAGLTEEEVGACLEILRPGETNGADEAPPSESSSGDAGGGGKPAKGECCVTCNGLTICAAYVETPCGGCGVAELS